MALTKLQRDAIELSLRLNLPFVAYSLPSQSEINFFADDLRDSAEQDVEKFSIFTWLSTVGYEIRAILSAQDVIDGFATIRLRPEENPPISQSTLQYDYFKRVTTLIGRLKSRGGKTVFSRVLCGDFVSESVPLAAIEKLFSEASATFNAVYFHPSSGAWIVASPELLLKADIALGEFSTMSLAGTRLVSDAGMPWSDKNLREQRIVTEYICDSLSRLGLKSEVHPLETVTSGPVQHLRNIITATGRCSPTEVAASLSPTPALGGYPVAESLADIAELEVHERRCYGGYMALTSANHYLAYVNLRCCNFNKDRYCLYAGGGITPYSTPHEEWDETTAKLSRLLPLFPNTFKL